MAGKPPRPVTYKKAIEGFFAAEGITTLNACTLVDLQGFFREGGTGKAPSTFHPPLAIIRSPLGYAHRCGYLRT